MRKKEQLLWDAMRRGMTTQVRMERLENVVGVGIPDVLVLADGVVTFCELKARVDFPALPLTRVLGAGGLSVAQRNWHMLWNRCGGRSLIVVGVGTGHLRQHMALWGRHGDRVNEMCWAELLGAACVVGAGPEFWPRLELVLRTPS